MLHFSYIFTTQKRNSLVDASPPPPPRSQTLEAELHPCSQPSWFIPKPTINAAMLLTRKTSRFASPLLFPPPPPPLHPLSSTPALGPHEFPQARRRACLHHSCRRFGCAFLFFYFSERLLPLMMLLDVSRRFALRATE